MIELDDRERDLLNAFQRGFPLTSRPFAEVAETLGVDEDAVIETARRLQASGAISRLGAVTRPNTAGASTLAAIAVPEERLEEVAAIVSARPEVNHNYEREHELNLWFVVTACDRAAVARTLTEIERDCGLHVIDLPLEHEYHIDLGFAL